jgi:hypothetical protein
MRSQALEEVEKMRLMSWRSRRMRFPVDER